MLVEVKSGLLKAERLAFLVWTINFGVFAFLSRDQILEGRILTLLSSR